MNVLRFSASVSFENFCDKHNHKKHIPKWEEMEGEQKK